MTNSPKEGTPFKDLNIYQRLNLIMSELGAIGKTQKNQQQKFMFRGIDQVYNSLNPLLIKYGVMTIPTILDQTQEFVTTNSGKQTKNVVAKVKYTFCDINGDKLDVITMGEGMDFGDKATSKALAIAHKYAIFQLFCIPTEEVAKDDPDRECYQRDSRRPAGDSPIGRLKEKVKQVLREKKINYAKLVEFTGIEYDSFINSKPSSEKIEEEIQRLGEL
jgi:hypothetical protein